MSLVMAFSAFTALPALTDGCFDTAASVYADSADLAAPRKISASASADSVTLSWSEVDGADAYRIYMKDNSTGKWIKLKSIANTQTVIKDLNKGTSYYFRVSVLTKSGKAYTEHGKSGTFKVTTLNSSLPKAPSQDYTGLHRTSKGIYYFKNGSLETGFATVGKKKYYFNPSTYKMTVGWLTVGSDKYYFLSDGSMAVGTKTIDGISYTFGRDGKLDESKSGSAKNKSVIRSVGIKESAIEILIGDKVKLKPFILPKTANQKVTYKSFDPQKATVSSDGLVTAKGIGTLKIRISSAEDSSVYTDVTVTVLEKGIKPTQIIMNDMKLHVGQEVDLCPIFVPTNTTDKDVKWSVSKSSVVSISDGVLVAKKAGDATVTVTSKVDTKVKCKFKVSVS